MPGDILHACRRRDRDQAGPAAESSLRGRRGGREPSQWEAYPHHQFLHTNGCLPCCDNGGCWKSRVVPLGDGDSKDRDLCEDPVVLRNGKSIPRCLDMISAADVIRSIERYLEFDREPRAAQR